MGTSPDDSDCPGDSDDDTDKPFGESLAELAVDTDADIDSVQAVRDAREEL